MKRTFALATALLFATGTALAMHCPKDMKAIDEALAKNPKLSEAQMKEVKAQRAKGEDCFAPVVVHQFDGQQPDDRQSHKAGPEGKALEGENVKRIAHVRPRDPIDHSRHRTE